jgi:actin-related protein
VARSLALCDAELQKELRGAVVCSGGSTLVPGFPARLEAELNALCPDLVGGPNHRPFSVVPDPIKPERGYNMQRGSAAWSGGSLFASLDDTYGCVAVSKAEWDEWGPSIVHRKFF